MTSIERDIKTGIANQTIIIEEVLEIKRRVGKLLIKDDSRKESEKRLFENIQEQKDILQEKIDIIETSVKHDILNEEKPKAESKFQDMHENSDKENAKQCKFDRKEYRKTEKVNVPFTIIQSQYVMNLLSTRMS